MGRQGFECTCVEGYSGSRCSIAPSLAGCRALPAAELHETWVPSAQPAQGVYAVGTTAAFQCTVSTEQPSVPGATQTCSSLGVWTGTAGVTCVAPPPPPGCSGPSAPLDADGQPDGAWTPNQQIVGTLYPTGTTFSFSCPQPNHTPTVPNAELTCSALGLLTGTTTVRCQTPGFTVESQIEGVTAEGLAFIEAALPPGKRPL